MADEYVRLCLQLWGSWDADAVVRDRATGTYADASKVRPIHFEGKLVAWSACFVHVYDIGAANPGGFSPESQDIYTEGISSPGLKLVDRGEIRQDVLDTLLNMVRNPEMVTLDIRSMIACNNVANDRMPARIRRLTEAPDAWSRR